MIQPENPQQSVSAVDCCICPLPRCVTAACAPCCKVRSTFALTSWTPGSPRGGAASGYVPALAGLSLFFKSATRLSLLLAGDLSLASSRHEYLLLDLPAPPALFR